ncbi:MAG: beta-galactosidase, partial [Bryobacteraceae bacterium]
RDYQIIMWQSYSGPDFAKLKAFGITGGQVGGRTGELPENLISNNLRWYVEGTGNLFYSEYHRYRPDRIQQWSWLQAKELYRKDPSSKEAFKRYPSFSDPAWLENTRELFARVARQHAPYRPFFYSLADESGIADLASFWDFDFSDFSLAGMREWLRQRYGTLSALNAEWDRQFPDWNAVTPDTTSDAMKRTDGNYSAWADFKEWMDVAYARALKVGVDAVHSVDPEARVSMGGAQMPGWGGYDYWRLSHVVDAMEPYDIGDNIEMLRSFNPKIAVVTTAFATGPWEKQRVWSELLHGGRGLILWDDSHGFLTKESETGARAKEVSPYYNEIRDGVGALLINSQRQSDPIAIHFSQASLRMEWMRENRPKGNAWLNRTSSTERRDNEFFMLRESYCRLLEDLGFQYKFVASEQVENGELTRGGYRALILPRSSALSDVEAREMERFATRGGVLISDGEAGAYDEHGRRRAEPALHDFVHPTGDTLNYHANRLIQKEGPVYEWMGNALHQAGLQPEYRVVDLQAPRTVGVETQVFRNGGVVILGLLSNPELRVNELGPPEFQSNDRFAKPRRLRVTLPAERSVYDIRKGVSLGRKKELEVVLDPYEPVLLGLLPDPAPALVVTAPEGARRGETANVGIRFAGAAAADTNVFHVEVTDGEGHRMGAYSGNVIGGGNSARKAIPIAVSDAPGHWQVTVRDALSGRQQSVAFDVL